MVGIDAGVYDIGARPGARTVIIDVLVACCCSLRDTSNSPSSILLRHVSIDGDDGVLLDVFNLKEASVILPSQL